MCCIFYLYNHYDTSDVAVNHVFFYLESSFFFSVSDWLKFLLIFSTKKKRIKIFLSCWTLNFRVRMYFISQNVMNNLVRNLSEFSFVWMLDVLFLSVGRYLKFKREFKNENVFVILFVKFVLWIFKEFYFCKKCVSFEREVFVWVLSMCLDSRSMLCGCNLSSNDVVRKFTNMKSDICLEGGVTCMLCW